MIQISRARESNPLAALERGCNVFGCAEKAVVVLEVGGGEDSEHTQTMNIRLCHRHGQILLPTLRRALKETENT